MFYLFVCRLLCDRRAYERNIKNPVVKNTSEMHLLRNCLLDNRHTADGRQKSLRCVPERTYTDLVHTACMCARYRFARYTRQRRERFGTRFSRVGVFFTDRQTDRFAITIIETQFCKLRTGARLVPMRCAAAGGTTFQSEYRSCVPAVVPGLLCARGLCRLAAPVACAGPASGRSVVSTTVCHEAENDNSTTHP